MNINEDAVIYCSCCGSANKPSAIICDECNKPVRLHHSSFYFYLLAHTKDKAKAKLKDTATGEVESRVEETILSLIINYLRSHIWGIVLSISVVTAGVTAASINTAPIEKVTERPQYIRAANQQTETSEPAEEEKTEPVDTVLEMETKQELWNLGLEYLQWCEYQLTGDSSYATGATQETLLAEHAGAGYSYSGVHDMMARPVNYEIQARKDAANASPNEFPTSAMYNAEDFYVNEQLTSQLGKKLREDGYEVAEGFIEGVGYYDGRVTDFSDRASLPTPDVELSYHMVYVKLGDKWYIAEDRLEG